MLEFSIGNVTKNENAREVRFVLGYLNLPPMGSPPCSRARYKGSSCKDALLAINESTNNLNCAIRSVRCLYRGARCDQGSDPERVSGAAADATPAFPSWALLSASEAAFDAFESIVD